MTTAQRIEFGDFQTPSSLARQVCAFLRSRQVHPEVILEPTCGVGNFLAAAAETFTSCNELVGIEVNPDHHADLHQRLAGAGLAGRAEIVCANIFDVDWTAWRARHPGRPLIVGNPPWVTVAGLSLIDGTNAPQRRNIDRLSGIDAKTGKSNFDIAEAIVLNLLRAFAGSGGTLALLIKTSVARRVLAHTWRAGRPIGEPTFYLIDAKAAFGVNVDACLFVADLPERATTTVCHVAYLNEPARRIASIGWRDETLVADLGGYDATANFAARGKPHPALRWRSGIKHDCGRVLELTRVDERFLNGRDELVEVEPHLLYPLQKGSDVANGGTSRRDRWMLVPQTTTGQDTNALARYAPAAWRYLEKHHDDLAARKSSIYRDRPPFAIFGVGPYTFQNWKIATCGLYKKLRFALVGPHEGRPVVFDDTVYHLSFDSRAAAEAVLRCLESDIAMRFFASRTFADAKRPVTASLLNELDLLRLASHLGVSLEAVTLDTGARRSAAASQPSLFVD